MKLLAAVTVAAAGGVALAYLRGKKLRARTRRPGWRW